MLIKRWSGLSALLVCASSWGATVQQSERSVSVHARVDSMLFGFDEQSDSESSSEIGQFDSMLEAQAVLGGSMAESHASMSSEVSATLIDMLALAGASAMAKNPPPITDGEPPPEPDIAVCHGESWLAVLLDVDALERWELEASQFHPIGRGFSDGYTSVTLVELDPNNLSKIRTLASMDTRLGQMTLSEGVTLVPGLFELRVEVRASADVVGSSAGAFSGVNLMFSRRPPCPGDGNGDLVVDFLDLNQVLSFFGQSVTAGTSGDLNGDGLVDFLDLNIVLSYFGVSC